MGQDQSDISPHPHSSEERPSPKEGASFLPKDSTKANQQAAVRMGSIHKVYPDGTVALSGVDLELKQGEIHGLLGENGAGKSTLMKIASGLIDPTRGEIVVSGEPHHFRSPADALAAGIGMVHQHFALVPTFTALQNLVLGQEEGGLLSALRLASARDRVDKVMGEAGLNIPLDVPIELLPVGVQQRVEIIKMLYRQVDVLILDEPTAVLTPVEVDEFFKTLRALSDKGVAIVLITHKLKEVIDVTEWITVLHQGEVAGHIPTAEATPEILARLMIGREALPSVQKSPTQPGGPILDVGNLSVGNDLAESSITDLSFQVRAGEVFGIAGVEGNGQTELVEAITGLRSVAGGHILMDGQDIVGLSPRALYRRGLAHVPEDRRRVGMVLDFTLAENGILGVHRTFRFHGILDKILWSKVYAYTRDLIDNFSILVSDVRTLAKNLSGGNQQKLVLAREFEKRPSLVVAVQPTRGLDVAATQYIRSQLLNLRDQGKAILLVSADLDEIFQLSDRIAVLYEGRFTGVASPEELDPERIGLMMGGMDTPKLHASGRL